jgi:hypothetical protein
VDLGKVLQTGEEAAGAAAEAAAPAAAGGDDEKKKAEKQWLEDRMSSPQMMGLKQSMDALKTNIECGRQWKKLYHLTAACIKRKNPGHCWSFPEASIFAQTDAFVQRCSDLLEICEDQLQFGAYFPNITNLDLDYNNFCLARNRLPKFGGSRWTEIVRSLLEIEVNFQKQIKKLADVEYDILDAGGGGSGGLKNSFRTLELYFSA